MNRVETLTELLSRYTELVDPCQSGNGSGDTGVRLMPATYTRSVRELERQMVTLRERDHGLWRHVAGRYLQATTKTCDVWVRRSGKNGKKVSVVERKVVTVWPDWVDETRTAAGIRWIASRWPMWEPELPTQLLVSAA